MYLFVCVFLFMHIALSNTERAEHSKTIDEEKERYLHLGIVYEQHIKTGLNYLGKIMLPDIDVTFKKANYSGMFSFKEGLLGMNLDIKQLYDQFHLEKVNPLPEGALDGVEVYYRFLVKKITIQHVFEVNLTGIGTFKGNAEFIITNQMFDANVYALKQEDGRCIFVDKGLNTTLDPKKYKADYNPEKEVSLKDNVMLDVVTILNTYVLKSHLKLIHGKINKKLIKLGETDAPFSGIDFQKEMEQALCHFEE